MKNDTKTKQGEARQRLFIERWTVERLDTDAGMVRIESVPMRSEILTKIFQEAVSIKGFEPSEDKLSFWDARRAKIRRISLNLFAREIGARIVEKGAITENMVFWALYHEGEKKPYRIYHTTRASRNTAKELYKRAALKGDSHD